MAFKFKHGLLAVAALVSTLAVEVSNTTADTSSKNLKAALSRSLGDELKKSNTRLSRAASQQSNAWAAEIEALNSEIETEKVKAIMKLLPLLSQFFEGLVPPEGSFPTPGVPMPGIGDINLSDLLSRFGSDLGSYAQKFIGEVNQIEDLADANNAAGVKSLLASLVTSYTNDRNTTQNTINQLNARAATLRTEIQALQNQINAKQAEINLLNSQIAAIQSDITQLQLAYAAATDDTVRAQIQAEINLKQSQLPPLQQSRTQKQSELNTLVAQRNAKQSELAAVEAEIARQTRIRNFLNFALEKFNLLDTLSDINPGNIRQLVDDVLVDFTVDLSGLTNLEDQLGDMTDNLDDLLQQANLGYLSNIIRRVLGRNLINSLMSQIRDSVLRSINIGSLVRNFISIIPNLLFAELPSIEGHALLAASTGAGSTGGLCNKLNKVKCTSVSRKYVAKRAELIKALRKAEKQTIRGMRGSFNEAYKESNGGMTYDEHMSSLRNKLSNLRALVDSL